VRRQAATVAGALAAGVLLLGACTYTTDDDPPDDEEAAVDSASGVSSTTVPEAATTTTTVPTADLGAVSIALEEVAQVDQPTALATRAGDPALYVTEQTGAVRRIAITTRRNGAQDFALERTPTIDLGREVTAEGEQGLLGITFSTDGNRLYLAFTGDDAQQHLVEFTMNGNVASASSRRDLLTIEDFAANHNGGQLAVGPDGFLYWGMGDGGGGGDPEGTGQDPDDLLGSILRIDPDVPPEADDVPYAIPDGNPFAGGGGAPEVWAYGLRNPWRFSFDRASGDLWIGDVGQDEVEEIDLLPAEGGTGAGRGANLGWSELEGDQPFEGGTAPDGAVAPLFAYDRSRGGCSVIGGYVYRGVRVPTLAGVYLFADYCEGRLRGITAHDGALIDQADLGVEVASPTAFGQDSDGELYVLSQEGGVYRVVAVP
jgi:glucose/arabinose dehydrogenase